MSSQSPDLPVRWVAPPNAGTVGSTALVRSLNERSLLDLLQRVGPSSRVDLARATGLSKPTVSAALANLEAYGLVEESGSESGKPGPAAVIYRPIAAAGMVASIDVGQTFLRVAIADLSGEVLVRSDVRNRSRSAGSLRDSLVRLLVSAMAETTKRPRQPEVIVIGGPGIPDETTATMQVSTIPGWGSRGFLNDLRNAFTAPVLFANDVNLAALGEHSLGAARGIDDFVLVSIGTGIGCGIVSRGELLRGATGAAGELGFLPLTSGHGTTTNRNGRRVGQLEGVAAAGGIAAAATAAGLSVSTAKDVFELAASGDRRAKKVITETAETLGRALAAVAALLDPALIVVAGGVGENVEQLRPTLEKALTDYAPVAPPIRAGQLGPAASLLGGITLALPIGRDRVFERLAR